MSLDYWVDSTPIMIDADKCELEIWMPDVYKDQLESLEIHVWAPQGKSELPEDWTPLGVRPIFRVHHGQGVPGMYIIAIGGKPDEEDDMFEFHAAVRPPKGRKTPHLLGWGWTDGRSIDLPPVVRG